MLNCSLFVGYNSLFWFASHLFTTMFFLLHFSRDNPERCMALREEQKKKTTEVLLETKAIYFVHKEQCKVIQDIL